MKIRLLLIILLLTGVFSCQKSANCFKEAGKTDTLVIEIGKIKYLRPQDPLDMVLVKDNRDFIQIIDKQLFINNIVVTKQADTIDFFDKNICYFMHDYDSIRPKIIVHFTGDSLIIMNRSALGLTTGTKLKLKFFVFQSSSYFANIDLELENQKTVISTWGGTGIYKLAGSTENLTVYSHYSAYIDALNLQSKNATVINGSVNDIKVSVSEELHAQILNIGNIYYSGSPQVFFIDEGDGKLIKL